MLALLLSTFFGSVDETWAVEIAWTTIASFGFLFSLYNFLESVKDLGAVEYFHVYNGRRLIARSNALAEGLRVLAYMIYISIGFWIMQLPHIHSTFPQPHNFFVFGIVFRYGLLATVCILSFNTFLAYRSRQALKENSLLFNGQKGEKGEKGATGDTGAKGAKGEKGDPGI